MHRAGPGQVNLSFYRNTMRNMQQQRQYIINLIVSWAFWDIQDERLNNLQSFVEQQWREGGEEGRGGSISEPGNVWGKHLRTLERARRWNTQHENEKPIWVQGQAIHNLVFPVGNIFTSSASATASGLTERSEASHEHGHQRGKEKEFEKKKNKPKKWK